MRLITNVFLNICVVPRVLFNDFERAEKIGNNFRFYVHPNIYTVDSGYSESGYSELSVIVNYIQYNVNYSGYSELRL